MQYNKKLVSMDCSTRALRQSAGYVVPPEESFGLAFYAAQCLVNREKLLSKKKSRGKNDGATTSISKTNAASDQQRNNQHQ